MKIDEDLIHEQLENLRNELAFHIRDYIISEEHKEHLLSIIRKLKGIVAICKKEQEVRDDERLMFDDRIGRIDYDWKPLIGRHDSAFD